MDVVVRTYKGKGSKELFSLLEKNKTDIEKVMKPHPFELVSTLS